LTTQKLTAADVIRLLDLKPHPEGGHSARRSATRVLLKMVARPRPRSIFCLRAASARTGIASMPPRSGIGMPALR